MKIQELNSPQNNFPIQNLLPGTGEFYNNRFFIENEVHILGTAMQQMNRALLEGLKEIRKAIES